ncbi:NRDE family protein [Sphaerisporangium fuscum]|uniref:NRDE family protein n=1 Tax=Sphaerisporangium fuscum TaxID=2835868 RepID=UPI001BDC0C4A|nr:NRDE family protein [Sphaerisporangium fuscum]
MCTVIVRFEAGAETPVVLAGVRDEFASRPWLPPAAHWPHLPGLTGGRDLTAGGTWLAVDAGARRVAALLNGRGVMAAEPVRRSRGDLPLRAAAAGELPEGDLSCYDPFHLLVADPGGVRLWNWDGERVTDDKLPEGVHVVVNSGWEAGDDDPKVAYFRPRFAAAPAPSAADTGDGSWARWRELASGAGLPPSDPRALVVRRALDDGRVWGTSSVTLVGLGEDAVRYDFCGRPGDPEAWYGVLRRPS